MSSEALKKLVIVGAGGLAREVRWLAEEINKARPTFEFVGYVVSDLASLGDHDSTDEVLGDESWLLENPGRFDALALGIGTPKWRKVVAERLGEHFEPEMWPALVHPNVCLDRGTCSIGHGVAICAGSIATVNVHFAPHSFVNLACTLGHEAVVGRYSVLNPTVNISGGVELGEGVLVGTGAQVLQYLPVGEGATVGAGAVVTKPVPAGEVWVGMPAKPLKR